MLRMRDDVETELRNGQIIKRAITVKGQQELKNAVRFYRALADTTYVPALIDYSDDALVIEQVRATPVTDENVVRKNCIHLLAQLLKYNIIHSDLTGYNYVIQDNVPKVFDWGEARFAWEQPLKRAGMDADWFYPSLNLPETTRIMARWRAIRDFLVPYRGFGTLVDLGTLYGDFVALAHTEGLRSVGYDGGYFDRACIDVASQQWQQYGCEFHELDLTDYDFGDNPDVILLFSTWTYLANRDGADTAEQFLEQCIQNCEILFFENHSTGDGFAPDWMTEDYLESTLKRMATGVEFLARIPVAGRNASRIVWKVT